MNGPRRRVLTGFAALTLTLWTSFLWGQPSSKPPPPTPANEPSAPSHGIVLRDITEATRIDFEHAAAPEKKFILESMSGGVALLDADDDGLLDIYFTNALTVATATETEGAPAALYHNQGDGTFVDIGRQAGVALAGWGMGVCVADVDGDGRQDLYVTGVGANRFFRNLGKLRFADETAARGIAASGWSTGCGFADYDRDGDLDLFVARYVEIDFDDLPAFGSGATCQYRGLAVQCGPRGLPGTGDLLFRNDGDRFTEVGKAAGVSDPEAYYGLGVAWLDVDEDGWLDLFVANDSSPNFLYRNRADGTFEETAFFAGVAVSEDGGEQGGMGVAVGDDRNVGRLSIFVTNFAEEYNALYRDEGSYFTDMSFRSGSAASSLPYVGWGTAYLDLDNDRWLDLVVLNGHVYPQLESAKLGASASYRQRRLVYRNLGGGRLREIGDDLGSVIAERRVSRGLAVGDLDNDGRLDLVINELDGRAQVLRNESTAAGHWLQVRLRGRSPNTDAIGALVKARTGKVEQVRLVRSGTGYLSQDDLRQHFGLGDAPKVDRLEIVWPDGTKTVREAIAADQILTVEQTPARPASSP